MAGRFFATGDTDTESSTESSDEEIPKANLGAIKRPQFMAFSDDEDEKRVVKSLKDKRYDEIKEVIRLLKNSVKIKDVAKVQTNFDSLQKAFLKAKAVIDKEQATPKFYLRALVDLEDFVKELWEDKEAKAKLNKINAKALAGLKQKVKKYNKDFEKAIEEYRANPIESEEEKADEEEEGEEEEDEVSESEDEAPSAPVKKEPKPTKPQAEGEIDSDDSIDWEMSESSSSDSEAGEEAGREFTYTAEYFLKKDKDVKESKARKRRDDKDKKRLEGISGKQDDDGDWETIPTRSEKQSMMTTKDRIKHLFGKEVELDHNIVRKKKDELMVNRGKKTTDRTQTIASLQLLLQVSQQSNLGVGVELLLLKDLIETTFDIPGVASCMKSDVWENCLKDMDRLVTLLEDNPAAVFDASVSDDEVNLASPDKPFKIRGSLLTFIERLDEEFTKILQATDAHATDFVTKLQGEATVAGLIQRVQVYLEKKYGETRPDLLCRIYIRTIEHVYYKIDRANYGQANSSSLFTGTEGELPGAEEGVGQESSNALMTRLTKFIYNATNVPDIERIRTRAMLCHIYHHAIHDRCYQARDLMLMSHLQESIQHADVLTQILYNRALVQLGMCAFRHGMIKDAHDALVDIQSSGRSKELLAQGLLARHDRTPEQEKLERRRQIPFHMHINLELMECVYLTAAMLHEIPYMTAAKREGRRRIISKSFHHQLKYHEKQPLIGPPESMREHVVAAAHAMETGNWKACRDYITSIKVWDLFLNVDQVKEMLTSKIQEESLRTYIFAFSEVYDCLSLQCLVDMFELPLQTVHSLVSKMIFKEELMASLDEPTQTVVIHHASPNKLQCQALLLADKLSILADQNEELMKLKHAGPWDISQLTGGAAGPFKQQWRPMKHTSQRRQAQARS